MSPWYAMTYNLLKYSSRVYRKVNVDLPSISSVIDAPLTMPKPETLFRTWSSEHGQPPHDSGYGPSYTLQSNLSSQARSNFLFVEFAVPKTELMRCKYADGTIPKSCVIDISKSLNVTQMSLIYHCQLSCPYGLVPRLKVFCNSRNLCHNMVHRYRSFGTSARNIAQSRSEIWRKIVIGRTCFPSIWSCLPLRAPIRSLLLEVQELEQEVCIYQGT